MRGGVGGTHQSIASRNDKLDGALSTKNSISAVGPGAYDTNSVKWLKTSARVTIGNSKRLLMNDKNKATIPGPDIYNPHIMMTSIRSNSQEKNAPRATIGNEPKEPKDKNGPTPGPQNYKTELRK